MSQELIFAIVDAIPFVMLGCLAVLLFTGLPVSVVLFGLGTVFCLIGIGLGEMPLAALLTIPARLSDAIRGSLFYPAVAMLLFMWGSRSRAG